MVRAVLRPVAPLFPSTTTITEPLPFPDAPDATPTQGAWLCAVHGQPFCAATPTVCVPPDASKAFSDRSSRYTQAAAACCTASDESLTSRSPRRVVTTAFGAIVYVTVPLPCPLADEEATPSQSASLRAVQEHSRLMVTVNVPLPPAASAVSVLAVSAGAQRDDDGAVTLVVDEDPQLAQKSSSQIHRLRKTVCDIGPRETCARSPSVSVLVSL
jgi:hypothetical protein